MQTAHLDLFADPLGDLHIEWRFFIAGAMEIPLLFPVPAYRYEMSKVFDIPVPFSSIAEEIDIIVHKVEIEGYRDISYQILRKFKGQHYIEITTENKRSLQEPVEVKIQYTIKKLVTRDRIYFSFVYPVLSPFGDEITIDINLTAHFSYHISSYKLKFVLIDPITHRINYDTKLLKSQRVGDIISAKASQISLKGDEEMDIHLHGSRLPVFIERRIFWIIIFLSILFLTVIGVTSIF